MNIYRSYMNKVILWVLLVLMTVCSCSYKPLELSYTPISLNSTDTNSVSFDDCFEISSCIPLEETENCHITDVRRIELFEDNYYVCSSNANTGLVVYDAKGRFLRRIGNKGNGHGEYTNILDFAIDKKNRRIILLCNRSSLVKIYSLEGIFQEEKVLHDTSLSNLACIDGVILCPTNHQGFTSYEEDSLFYIFDESLNFIKKKIYISNNNLGMSSFIPSNTRTYGNKFVYSDFHEHRTFILNKHGDVEKCYEYQKDRLIPISALKDTKVFLDNQFDYDFILNSVILNGKCKTVYKEGQRMKLSINRNDGECVINKPLSVVLPDFLGCDNEEILSIISLDNLKAISSNPNKDYGTTDYYIIRYKAKNL